MLLIRFDLKKVIKVLELEKYEESKKEKVNSEKIKVKIKVMFLRMKEFIKWVVVVKFDKVVKFFIFKV